MTTPVTPIGQGVPTGRRDYTIAELDQIAQQFAGELLNQGLRPDRARDLALYLARLSDRLGEVPTLSEVFGGAESQSTQPRLDRDPTNGIQILSTDGKIRTPPSP